MSDRDDGGGRFVLRWGSILDVVMTLRDLDLIETMDINEVTIRVSAGDRPRVYLELAPRTIEIELEDPEVVMGGTLEDSEEELETIEAPRREAWGEWPAHIYDRSRIDLPYVEHAPTPASDDGPTYPKEER